MRQFSSDIAFTSAVEAIQAEKGSRSSYARMETGGSWETRVTPELAAFLAVTVARCSVPNQEEKEVIVPFQEIV